MRASFPRAAVLAIFTALLVPQQAQAQERPLIWEFRKNSDTFYAARLGSRLPIGADAGMGAEIRVRGPDIAGFSHPVLWWATLTTEGGELRGAKRTTRIDLRSLGIDGSRSLSINNVFSGHLGMLDAELVQNHTFNHEPTGNGEVRIHTTRSVRVSSAHAGTVLIARASRAHDADWRTIVGVEQSFRKDIRFSATIEEPGAESRKGMFRASYSRKW